MTNIISWNCRGSGGMTISTINRYLHCTKAQIAFFSETKCDLKRATKRISELPLCNAVVVPSEGSSGGLWLVWGDEFQITVVEKSKSLIAAQVVNKASQKKWGLLAVYGDPNRTQNPIIWSRLENYLQDQNQPVCLLGDFNAVASATEKWGGSQSLSNPNRAFRAWISEVGLMDLGYHGPAYTWSNKKDGVQNISERLDRGLANTAWAMMFPNTQIYHLPRFQSDHLPILLRTNPMQAKAKPRFRCENWWLQNSDFKEVCKSIATEPTENWSQFTKNFRKGATTWSRK